jgi:hypothetical protein
MTIRKTSVWGFCLAISILVSSVVFAQGDALPPVPQLPSPPQSQALQAQTPPEAQPPQGQTSPEAQPPQQTPPQQTPPQQTPPPQTPPPQTPPQQTQQQTSQPEPVAADPDTRPDPLQPDFNLVALPTTLRLPKHKGSFRLTHRFLRSLGADDFSEVLANLFQFDTGAQIGLEFRYGLFSGTQIGVHRTSDRTIELFGQQSLMQQKPDGRRLSIDAIGTFEGTNNLQDQYTGAIGVIVSTKIRTFAALYAEPIFVVDSNLEPSAGESKNTGMVGLGARLRLRPKLFLVGELTPRFAGYRPGVNQASFGVETRVGGHTFQLNFSNGLGTTLGQIARGGINNNSWFIGFNLSRKFY